MEAVAVAAAAVAALTDQWTAPALEEVLPELSREEQLRVQARFRERDTYLKRHGGKAPSPEPLHTAQRVELLDHPSSSSRSPPLQCKTPRQTWFHLNFWTRSRTSNKIKRFFAEVHYKLSTTNFISLHGDKIPVPIPIVKLCSIIEEPLSQYRRACTFCASEVHYKLSTTNFISLHGDKIPVPIPIVELCTIIEEPLSQYRRACAFCPSDYDILHPKGPVSLFVEMTRTG
ncbi:hypothetical protein ACP4OV_017369 [Aristida adscensionis]